MDSDGSNLYPLLAALVLLALKAFCSFCEFAITNADDSKIRELASTNPSYYTLFKLISKPRRLLISFSSLRIILTSAVAVLVSATLVYPLSDFIVSLLNIKYNSAVYFLSLALLILCSSLVAMVFGEILPKRTNKEKSESAALKSAGFIKFLTALLYPFTMLSSALVFVFCKLFGLSVSAQRDEVTEEKILMMVEAGNETGVIEENQCEMINNIFQFGDSSAGDIMTHRTDIVAVNISDRISDVVYLAINEGFSRLPVYEESVDNIIGIMYVKDLLCLVGCENPSDFNLSHFMREAMYVPQSAGCAEIFEDMSRKKQQMAVVVDEYGGTAGIVTMEDILESIVGNIRDEYDIDEEDECIEISEGIFTIDGSADPDDIFPLLNLKLPDNHNYDTMSALIVDLLGRIPDEDETPSVQYQNVVFTVLVSEDNWVSKIKAAISKAASSEL